jgi:hypothetical protein
MLTEHIRPTHITFAAITGADARLRIELEPSSNSITYITQALRGAMTMRWLTLKTMTMTSLKTSSKMIVGRRLMSKSNAQRQARQFPRSLTPIQIYSEPNLMHLRSCETRQ